MISETAGLVAERKRLAIITNTTAGGSDWLDVPPTRSQLRSQILEYRHRVKMDRTLFVRKLGKEKDTYIALGIKASSSP